MKHQNGNFFWGIFFIAAAVLILLNQLGLFRGISLYRVLLTIVLIAILIKGIRYRQFGSIFFPLAFLWITYARPLGLWHFSTWSVLLVALFATAGFSMLFPSKWRQYSHNYHPSDENYSQVVDCPDEQEVNYHVSFGSSIKYINSVNFRKANLSCSFGALKVYFDKTTPSPDGAQIHLDASFGGVELYIPRSWKIINEIEPSIGGVNERNKDYDALGTPVLLTGNVSFGAVEIIYI